MNRLSHQEEIYNGLIKWKLPFYFSKPVINHLTHFIDGMLSVGFTGKLTEIHSFSHQKKHRTTLGHFLKKGSWNEGYLLRQTQEQILQKMDQDEPVFLLLDDTICEKTKPSSQASTPTESCGYHFSHTDGKSVWGHQVVQLMLKNGDQAYPYEFRLFHKETTESKIKLSIEMIKRVPALQPSVYLLCDSWYTSGSIIDVALSKGIHVIGALKTNRILYPQGIRIQAKEFARYIREEETDLVTIGHESYRVYRYEGALNDLDMGVVLMCWKEEHPMEPKHMRCFLSTDTELTTEQILSYYSQRWSIETYFKQVKGMVGFNGYQVRSERAIKRFWTIVQFTYVFAMYLRKAAFNLAIQCIRKQKIGSIIEFVYRETTNGTSLEQIKNELQVA
ncbi:IS701 family transposase [Priestia flexa]|uniref:IS701 family transposase n=1 Tax=Priestia TaxID=2800373 RepID=UPI00209F3463|nr:MULTISPECIES: IS701 family transposase [Priestia]MCP1187866.1 IS701 family transposase [Priestia flexa]MCP1188968.1 IS701 family transposase [Priestia flexa]MCP1190069.1 IS701 family transposase [Priestia flexa]MCP1190177.1 IS701 family transposase [Priestia flexa]MCP1190910.1 IS701 family transposase [Priestia flexa]